MAVVGLRLAIKMLGVPNTVKLTDAFVESLSGNPMRRMLRAIAHEANDFRQGVTHIATGTLRESEKSREVSRTKWELIIDESFINPRNKVAAFRYALVENARGSPHDFQSQTLREIPDIIDRHLEDFAAELDNK